MRWEYQTVWVARRGFTSANLVVERVNGKEFRVPTGKEGWFRATTEKQVTLDTYLEVMGQQGWEASGGITAIEGIGTILLLKRQLP